MSMQRPIAASARKASSLHIIPIACLAASTDAATLELRLRFLIERLCATRNRFMQRHGGLPLPFNYTPRVKHGPYKSTAKGGLFTTVTRLTSLLRDILIASVYGLTSKLMRSTYQQGCQTCYDAHPQTEHSTRHSCLCLPSTMSLIQMMHVVSLAARGRNGCSALLCCSKSGLGATWITGAISPNFARAKRLLILSGCLYAKSCVTILRSNIHWSVLACELNAQRCYALPAFAPTILNVIFAAVVTVATATTRSPIYSLPLR